MWLTRWSILWGKTWPRHWNTVIVVSIDTYPAIVMSSRGSHLFQSGTHRKLHSSTMLVNNNQQLLYRSTSTQTQSWHVLVIIPATLCTNMQQLTTTLISKPTGRLSMPLFACIQGPHSRSISCSSKNIKISSTKVSHTILVSKTKSTDLATNKNMWLNSNIARKTTKLIYMKDLLNNLRQKWSRML